MSIDDVMDGWTLADFAQQNLGLTSDRRGAALFVAKAAQLMEDNPRVTWQTFARTVRWARKNNRHLNHLVGIVNMVSSAHDDGFLPELDKDTTSDPALDALVNAALQVEQEKYWRGALLLSEGKARHEVYLRWAMERGAAHGIRYIDTQGGTRADCRPRGPLPVQSTLDLVG